MPGQQTCAPPVVVTLPAQLDAAAAEQAVSQITAAFTPGVGVVIADLTTAACCNRSAIRNLLKAHPRPPPGGGQVRFAIRPGGPLHQITSFAGSHPLLAVYPSLQHAITGRAPIPPGNRAASRSLSGKAHWSARGICAHPAAPTRVKNMRATEVTGWPANIPAATGSAR